MAALRKAFDETLRDPEYIADAAHERFEIRALSGSELAVVTQMIETPADLRERVKHAIRPSNVVSPPGAKPGSE